MMLEHRDTKNLSEHCDLWMVIGQLSRGWFWMVSNGQGWLVSPLHQKITPNVSTNISITSPLIRKLSPLRRLQGSESPLRRKEYPAHSSTCGTIFLPGVPRSSKHICALGKSPPCPALVVTVSATTAPCVAEHYRRFLFGKIAPRSFMP